MSVCEWVAFSTGARFPSWINHTNTHTHSLSLSLSPGRDSVRTSVPPLAQISTNWVTRSFTQIKNMQYVSLMIWVQGVAMMITTAFTLISLLRTIPLFSVFHSSFTLWLYSVTNTWQLSWKSSSANPIERRIYFPPSSSLGLGQFQLPVCLHSTDTLEEMKDGNGLGLSLSVL